MLLGIAVVSALVLAALVTVLLQDAPVLEAATPPTAQDVAATRTLVRGLRTAANETSDVPEPLETDATELNSAIRLGARFIPGFRGRIEVAGDAVLGQAAVPVRWLGGPKWLNVTGRVPAFDGAFRLDEVTVGPVSVPPYLAVSVARIGANLALGNRFGDKVLQAATAMRIEGERLSFDIALGEMGKNGVMRSAFGAMRGNEMPGPEEVEKYHVLIRTAMAEGELRQEGSFLPYVRFALEAALEHGTPETLPNDYTAAIFGLAKACGAADFSMIVGRLAFDPAYAGGDWPTSCDEVRFNGRIDSRRHFITSAALQAASNTGVSVSIGEFKELYDTISGAGGFDFTDMAANLSGIRLSDRLMSVPAAGWPALLALLETENDVIVPFDGIPQLMPEAAFAARYGTVESDAYKAEIAAIEAKIDRLPLYAR